jgi:hypothetical protein
VTICAVTRARLAPSAWRTTISDSRIAVRAKISVVTFAQTVPSTSRTDGVDQQIFQPHRITRRAPGECANARAQLRVGCRQVGGKVCRDDVELRRGALPARSVGEAAVHLHGWPFPRRRV